MDTRCRYKYSILIDNVVIWCGYLLHEEAWVLLKTIDAKSKSIIFDADEISNRSEVFLLK